MLKEVLEKTVSTLKRGGLILYPTDTVWGIGCDATNADAVERIYSLKKSLHKHEMLVLIDNPDNLGKYFNKLPHIAYELFDVSDKPLTLILPGASGVACNLIPEDGTLGVRIPNHDFCKALINKLHRPIVSTSANISGQPTPLTYSEISNEIITGVDFVVDARFEGSPTRKASSIIKLGDTGQIEIIRK